MTKDFLKKLLYPLSYIRAKTRPLRRGRNGLKRRLLEVEKITGSLAKLYASDLIRKLLNEPRSMEEKRLLRFGFKVYSQSDEDGIIAEIFHRIGTTNKTFLEIGSSGGLESNTLYLLLQGWKGFWVDGSSKFIELISQKFSFSLNTGSLKAIHRWVHKENINQLIEDATEDGQALDLLSLDIDGNDYHILDAIESLNARVLVVEYNPKFRPPVKWVMSYNPSHSYDGSDYMGASLKSFEILLLGKGYKLVGCNLLGINAFFVRKDLMKDNFHSDCSAENHYESERFFLNDGLSPLHAASFGPFEIK